MIETDSQRRPWEGDWNQKRPSKDIGRGPWRTNAYPASGLLPGNASNTDAGPPVPLDAGSHIFYILMVFHLHFKEFSFFFQFTSGKTS